VNDGEPDLPAGLENTQLCDQIARDARPTLIVQAPQAYRALTQALERADAVQGIRAGLESIGRGEGRPADEAFDELRRKHSIPTEV
jgi:hypothetical protein